MVAVVVDTAPARRPGLQPVARPALRLVDDRARVDAVEARLARLRAQRRLAARFRRRRLAAVAGLVATGAVATFVVAPLDAATLGGGARPSAGPGAAAEVPPSGEWVVAAGDTLWSIARAIQPSGDVRALVDRLVEANGGDVTLRVGARVALP